MTISQKPTARALLRDLLSLPRAPGIREQAVRINAVSSGLALADLTAVLAAPHIDAIVVPKVDRASDLTFVSDVLAASSHANVANIRVVALIESARALMDIREICAASPRLSGLVFAAEDFSLDLSLTRTPSLTEFLFARQTIVAAARAYNLDSAIDLVCTDYKDPTGALTRECEGGSGMGFTGKQCIHPSQIATVQAMFAPSETRVRDAVRLLCAEKEAERLGKGSWALDGRMVDRPVIEAARAVVRKAELAGMSVKGLWEEFEHVVPE